MFETVDSWTALIAVALTAGIFVWLKSRRNQKFRSTEMIPGPKALPIIGNALQFKTESEAFYLQLESLCSTYADAGFCRLWFGPHLVVLLYRADHLETLLNSSKHIKKSFFYKFHEPWLGTGLLTSNGEKWFKRRKQLTPTFHFKILEEFLEVMNEQVEVLVKILDSKVGQGPFDVMPCLTHCALDIICDTAMGRHIDAQHDKDSEYVKALYRMAPFMYGRVKNPMLWSEFIFKLHPVGKAYFKNVKIIHDFTRKVMKERSEEFDRQWDKLKKDQGRTGAEPFIDNDSSDGKPIKIGKRMAFLDLLLLMAKNDPSLTQDDIQEEVDTFMFAGHDTTAATAVWALYNIGRYPEVQAKLQQEVDRVFGYDDRLATMEDLNQLKYFECVLKESMRLYPTAPLFAREICEDCEIGGCFVPKGSSAFIMAVPLHRDPKYFKDPDKFDPERWLTENPSDKHPFCYIPFSAGQRNCIGQRFAMMEEKVLLSRILRKFNITCIDSENINRSGLIILRPLKGVHLTLTRRFE